ncbi:MAG: hypothetical protein HOV80_38710 [Polyangiaceae bacterium]|nr:hypothetical protein [Polyangiaceae bacterium]
MLIGIGICTASLGAYAAGCSHDPAKPFVEWAAEACSCTKKDCAEELRADLPELYEDLEGHLVDKRIVIAEEAGASCLEIQGIEVERHIGDRVRRVQRKR